MYNLTGYYENDLFGARLMYNYRSEWYKYVHFNGDELYGDAYGQWDASFNYKINDMISLTIDAVNLNNEAIREYNGDSARLMSLYENGRRFVVGARMSF
jgi:iron complex outermembrane receptor protein